VLGCGVGGGTGAPLLLYTFSLFVLPITSDLHMSRSELALAQSFFGLGALGSPVIGWAADRFGFRRTFTVCMLGLIAAHLWAAFIASSFESFAAGTLVAGFLGMGTTALALTRPVNAWFHDRRGMALGLMATCIVSFTIVAPPLIEFVIASHGWRAGFALLAALGGLLGLPAVWWLVRDEPPRDGDGGRDELRAAVAPPQFVDISFVAAGDFWRLGLAFLLMSVAGAALVSQLVPIMRAEGLGAREASLAISAFAAGQVLGRLTCGFCLDRYPPRRVAALFTVLPAAGFVVLLQESPSVALALIAAALVGLQQGAEIDILAYFTARRFGMRQYGAIFGLLYTMAWVGTAAGGLLSANVFDRTASYDVAHMAAALALALAAALVGTLELSPRATARAV
jgi:predicted MFS family arabinose efflux permease